MGFYRAHFEANHPVVPHHELPRFVAGLLENPDAEVERLAVGEYDLSPTKWPDHLFQHFLHVHSDLLATYIKVPKVRGARNLIASNSLADLAQLARRQGNVVLMPQEKSTVVVGRLINATDYQVRDVALFVPAEYEGGDSVDVPDSRTLRVPAMAA